MNDKQVGSHKGAYTGFVIDITDYITEGDNVIAVRVDSQRQPGIPPEGGVIDYCIFGGIVRDVTMIVISKAYISDTFFVQSLFGKTGTVVAAVTSTGLEQAEC